MIIFLLIFGLVILVRKFLKKEFAIPWEMDGPLAQRRGSLIPWEMSGWLFHILMDIPIHSYAFYATPIFWPIAGWKFSGYP